MSKNKFSKRKIQDDIGRLESPLGYYMIEDHGTVISCIRYFDEGEKQEIEMMSKMAQVECKHDDKQGKCCVLLPATKGDWYQWH